MKLLRHVDAADLHLLRAVSMVMTGSALTQAIPVLAAPLMTRLFDATAFGRLAALISLSALFAVAFGGRYDFAIILPKYHSSGVALFAAATFIAWTAAAVVAAGAAGAGALGAVSTGLWSWPTIATAAMSGALQVTWTSSINLLNRFRRYRDIARAGVFQSLSNVLLSGAIGVSLASEWGLVLGFVAGQCVGLVFALHAIRPYVQFRSKRRCVTAILIVMRRFRHFPKYSLPAGIVETGALQVPVIAIGSMYGGEALGLFSVAQRLTRLPLTLLSGSVGTVFRREAAAQYIATGSCRGEVKRTLALLLLVSIIPGVTLLLFSETLFGLVLGREWRPAGAIVRVLLPALLLQFVVSPVSNVIFVAAKNVADFAIQASTFAFSVAVFGAAYWLDWPLPVALGLYVGVYCLKYITEASLAYRWSVAQRSVND